MGTISLETLFSRMFSQTLLSKDDSAQVFTHTPLHTDSGGLPLSSTYPGGAGQRSALRRPQSPSSFPSRTDQQLFMDGSEGGRSTPGVLPDAPHAASAQVPQASPPRPPHPTPKPRLPASHARRPGSLTVGDTARHILAIATLEQGLALKILYEAESRRAPGSHRYGPRRLRATQPNTAAAAAAAASTAPQCSARASEDRAKPLGSSRAGKTWQPA